MDDTHDSMLPYHVRSDTNDLIISPELVELFSEENVMSFYEGVSFEELTALPRAPVPGLWTRELYHQMFCYCGPLLRSEIAYRNICNAFADLAPVWAELDRKSMSD